MSGMSLRTQLQSLAGALVTLTAVPALAQETAKQPPAFMSLLPMVVVFGIFYFFMIRPQMRRQKTHQEFLTKLQRGDEVLTSGGILGRIEGLTDLYVTLEIAPSVRIKVLRSQVASTVAAPGQGQEVKA